MISLHFFQFRLWCSGPLVGIIHFLGQLDQFVFMITMDERQSGHDMYTLYRSRGKNEKNLWSGFPIRPIILWVSLVSPPYAVYYLGVNDSLEFASSDSRFHAMLQFNCASYILWVQSHNFTQNLSKGMGLVLLDRLLHDPLLSGAIRPLHHVGDFTCCVSNLGQYPPP